MENLNCNYRVKKSDILDIFKLYKSIRKKFESTAIMESLGEYNDEKSRYSIIGVSAKEILSGDRNECILEDRETGRRKAVDWLQVLDEWTSLFRNTCVDSPIQLGAIGYIGYEEKHRFEELYKRHEKSHTVPSVFLIRYSILFFYDHKANQSFWVFDSTVGENIIEGLEKDSISDMLHNSSPIGGFYSIGDIVPDFNLNEYLEKINKTVDYIKNGDIFQANITERFHGSYMGDPFYLYEFLRDSTPNPFFAFFDFEYPLISTSPERFIKISGREISTNPIKGTIRCMINGNDQRGVLANSEKNRAENTMIVDLMRNDIGRICVQGTVEVSSLCDTIKFNTLYHLESVISGTMKEDVRFSDVLKATFPGGSITGAPKIRAMDIIEELENTQRGPYTGITGFFGENGWIDTSIAIRIIYFDKTNFYFHAGGGIVVDSEAEDEYQELMLKVELLKQCINEFNILKSSRDKIDLIDDKIMSLMEERFKLIKNVGILKKQYNIPVLQQNRVEEIIKKRKALASVSGNIPREFIQELYELVIKHSMNIEKVS